MFMSCMLHVRIHIHQSLAIKFYSVLLQYIVTILSQYSVLVFCRQMEGGREGGWEGGGREGGRVGGTR